MTTRKMRLTVIGLIIIVLLLLLLWLLWFLFKSDESPSTEPSVETPQTTEGTTESEPTLKEQQLKQEQDTRNQSAGAITIAKIFTERYGSYSNEANFQNLIDVLPLMTDTFAQETEVMIENSTLPETYYGVTTIVLIVNVEKMDEVNGTAEIRLNTQREIAKDSPQNVSVENQEILLELARIEGVWKVASADWL
ncbi:hypothetical protein HY771_03540 [Candidatus Uhrbacteria bacterium]|nr:hypothetical protein [Candidatus Uhrbacteria bacterium]